MLAPSPAAAVRVVTYNILNFPGTTGTAREDDFRTVVEQLDADVIVVQEMLSQTGVNQFLNNILNYSQPGTYAAGPFINGYDTDNAVFYRISTIDLVSTQRITTALRDINEYVVRPVGYASSGAEFAVYSLHLKAGSTSTDLTKRLAEATILRGHMNALAEGSHHMVAGDFNIRASTEAAYQKLVGSEANNIGRVMDPLGQPGNWHDNYSFAAIHTQSPRTTAFGGGATGGMDDRFDQILISYPFDDGEGLDYIHGSHVAYGNDGLHFNMAINTGTNYAVGSVIADALHEAADHLPVYADFQVPAKIDAPAAVAFGDVIVGALAIRPLAVDNIAVAPADELDYSLSVPAGFTAPAGPFAIEPGETGEHDVTLNTSAPGVLAGTLDISSDDVDVPLHQVDLSGTVLAHAVPSLDEFAHSLTETLDFGAHEPGDFTEGTVSAFNFGYSGLTALLEVHAAEFTGGDGRFSLVGGFAPQTAGVTPAEYALEFDSIGAAGDSLYEAILTLRARDDTGVQGWAELDSLTVHLSAFVVGGSSVPEDEAGTFALSLASHTPFRSEVSLALRLPERAIARVSVYDVSGRLVRTLLDRELPAGVHPVVWDGRDDRGRTAGSGVYLSLAVVGDRADSRKLVLLR